MFVIPGHASLAWARNPYSRWWLWIPGSRAEPVIGPARGRTRWLAPGNDGLETLTLIVSIRLRQAEHFLGDETQDQLRADRRDAGDQGFAQIALDMIFLGVTKTAMGHHGLLAGLKAGFAREIFCGIRRRAAGQALVVF